MVGPDQDWVDESRRQAKESRDRAALVVSVSGLSSESAVLCKRLRHAIAHYSRSVALEHALVLIEERIKALEAAAAPPTGETSE